MEGLLGVAVIAADIAVRQPDEHARQSHPAGFALDAVEYLVDNEHAGPIAHDPFGHRKISETEG